MIQIWQIEITYLRTNIKLGDTMIEIIKSQNCEYERLRNVLIFLKICLPSFFIFYAYDMF
jgi:hypothetical protein